MEWTDLHGRLLGTAFEKVLGQPRLGAMAVVRCLTPDVIEALGADSNFDPADWTVRRVAEEVRSDKRTVTADQAVEVRESKTDATLLLVDTERAGAGMDGIYSASREVHEATLFDKAQQLANREITRRRSANDRSFAERAVRKARGRGGLYGVSCWAEFDFLCRVAAGPKSPGAYLHLLGLWPVLNSDKSSALDNLNTSRMFVDRLLGADNASLTPAARVDAVRLDRSSEREAGDLERFLHSVDTQPLLTALGRLANNEHLWVGALRTEQPADSIRGIELTSWRNRKGSIAIWCGLTEEVTTNEEENQKGSPPVLILKRDADRIGRDTTLEVRWKTDPPNLEKNAAEYRISIVTDVDEELAVRNVAHSARKTGEKCLFSNDDFATLDEDSHVPAKVVVEVVGNDGIGNQESEDFIVRFGELPPKGASGGVGERVRTFSEGLAVLRSRDDAYDVAVSPWLSADSKGFILMRTPVEHGRRNCFRVFRTSLIAEVETQWIERQGAIGRWIVRVRGTGNRAEAPEFEPIEVNDDDTWKRTLAASRKMAERFKAYGGVAQVYDDTGSAFALVQEYLRAWSLLLEQGNPTLALAHTVEVQSLSGNTIGLIVLPAHPLRVAWHAAYDNLVLYSASKHRQSAGEIRKEFAGLDGAMFPAFLPNLKGGTFVFADMLGFHAVGMVPDSDNEPKAALAFLARALGDGESTDTAPTIGSQSAGVLADEILRYLDCHKTEDNVGNPVYASRYVHIHALRAGDGMTVARALGDVHARCRQDDETGNADGEEEPMDTSPVFSLDLHPSKEQRGVAGRFIAEARERRRSGAGVLPSEDRWMLESRSLPGGVNMPRLRWSRKERQDPDSAAHLAVAFDTFESQVFATDIGEERPFSPHHAFGLLSFYSRRYSSYPFPTWESTVPIGRAGEKHPSRPSHTDSLKRLQESVGRAVALHLGSGNGLPVLKTEISREKAVSLERLHRLCDWVVTLDRNAGVEYFDSPQDNPEIYDAYVIDCVPEREDLGCLQLITSTANLDEVRRLLDGALDQMGLSHSRRNAEFLLSNLKALSGRLAIRLTGYRPATSELIALAVSHAHCQRPAAPNGCWVSLENGFIVPVDDVRDLLPPLAEQKGKDEMNAEEIRGTRPDLVYVTTAFRQGLVFQFIEVKYRRHLRTARSPELLDQINRQTQGLRERWERWYGHERVCSTFRAVRRAKLARVLRFYADKARRHRLSSARHSELIAEVDRMIERGGDYGFAAVGAGDRGWVFCPEYTGLEPLRISPDDWDTQIFLFGSALLPDAILGFEQPAFEPTSVKTTHQSNERLDPLPDTPDSGPDDAGAQSVGEGDATNAEAENGGPSVRLGTDTRTHAKIEWPLRIKGNPHLLIAGLPGMGKTTCLVNLCRQLVAANIRPIVFSYHPDIDQRLDESLGAVQFVDFDDLSFNPLQVIDHKSKMPHLDVAGAMRDIFSAIFPEIGDIQGDRIRTSIKESFEEAGWGSSAGASEPAFRRFLEILRSDPRPDRGLRTLLARLGELDDYGFFNTNADSQVSSLWELDHPSVIRIHSTQNENLQRAFACLVFYGLYKDMFRRGIQDRITHALVFDEAHRAARLKLIPTMAKECRKYGISLVLASQEARDFDTSVFSAIANYLVLRSTETDAKFLVRNVSSSQQERSLIDRIKQMERFKALYFAEGKSRPSQVALSP